MNFPVTVATKSDQVALGILALIASESSVMNFDRAERAAGLAAPTVPFEDLLVQPVVGIGTQPNPAAFP